MQCELGGPVLPAVGVLVVGVVVVGVVVGVVSGAGSLGLPITAVVSGINASSHIIPPFLEKRGNSPLGFIKHLIILNKRWLRDFMANTEVFSLWNNMGHV